MRKRLMRVTATVRLYSNMAFRYWLNEKQMVTLDEERKAAMVSNLLVVLCGNHDAQPVVNSGSLY